MERNEEPRYVISVAARILGTQTYTLRYYERIGLVEPKRSQGNLTPIKSTWTSYLLSLPPHCWGNAGLLRTTSQEFLAKASKLKNHTLSAGRSLRFWFMGRCHRENSNTDQDSQD